MRVLIVLIIGLALTGCALYDPPPKPMKLASEIGAAKRSCFSQMYLDADTKQAVLEAMRNRECSANPT